MCRLIKTGNLQNAAAVKLRNNKDDMMLHERLEAVHGQLHTLELGRLVVTIANLQV